MLRLKEEDYLVLEVVGIGTTLLTVDGLSMSMFRLDALLYING